MILSDRDLLARLERGDLVVDPLDDPETQIQPASIDLRLGSRFLEFRRTNIPCIHPDSEREVDEYVTETVVDGDGEFILHPGDFVLGTTKERVEIPPDLVANVEGRSSLGRLAVVVHASLPYDEEVFLWTPDEGFGFYEIGDIVENERAARAVSFDPHTLRVNTFDVTDYITNPAKRIYEVTLESGRQVRVTRDHNLFTLDSMGEPARLPSEDAEGRYVMIPERLPGTRGSERRLDLVDLFADSSDIVAYATDGLGEVAWDDTDAKPGTVRHYERRNSAPLSAVRRPHVPENAEVAFKQSDAKLPRYIDVTPELGWALGFYVAEGYGRRKQIVATNTNRAYLERFADVFRDYNTSLSWQEQDGYEQVTVCSALWSALFDELCGRESEKTIPDRAWNWPDEVLAAFYEGLIDGDGSRRESRDTLYTSNAELANRAAYLGSRLGKVTSLYSRDREQYIDSSDTYNEYTEWCVDFAEDTHKKGQFLPTPSDLLASLREEAGLTMREVADRVGYSSKSSVSNVENDEYDGVKRETLERFRDVYQEAGCDVSRLDAILNGHVRFDRVESVEETDSVERTYDLEVQPKGARVENFLGGRGGVFLSNTAGFIDPGFRGKITLELSNLGTAPVSLKPDTRISQLVFTELSSPAERPYGVERGSKYQDQDGPQASRIQDDPEFER
jgi:dCTP deaminase